MIDFFNSVLCYYLLLLLWPFYFLDNNFIIFIKICFNCILPNVSLASSRHWHHWHHWYDSHTHVYTVLYVLYNNTTKCILSTTNSLSFLTHTFNVSIYYYFYYFYYLLCSVSFSIFYFLMMTFYYYLTMYYY